jgi:glutaconate CoA-transferase, subunit B
MVSKKVEYYTIDELMAWCMAKTIKDGDTVFNGVAVPLPFTAIMLAGQTHAPNSVFWGGLLAGLNPKPPFLPKTSGDSVMLSGANPILHLHQIFDLAMRGELDRIFFSGAQIDKYGNLNNTLIGSLDKIHIKLPGGAGSSHIACFAKNFTAWSVRHEAPLTSKGKKIFTFVQKVDFVTTPGQKTTEGTRKDLGIKGGGPDCIVTDLGVFDFDPETFRMRVKSIHPGLTLQDIQDNTEFELLISENVGLTPAPTQEEVEIIRKIDPMDSRKEGLSPTARCRKIDF